MASCTSSKVTDVASFEFDNAWYWVVKYEPGTTKQEVEEYVTKWANPKQTSYFYCFPTTTDVEFFAKEPFNFRDFAYNVLQNKPKYGYYKMPTDTKLNDDGIWLLEQSNKH